MTDQTLRGVLEGLSEIEIVKRVLAWHQTAYAYFHNTEGHNVIEADGMAIGWASVELAKWLAAYPVGVEPRVKVGDRGLPYCGRRAGSYGHMEVDFGSRVRYIGTVADDIYHGACCGKVGEVVQLTPWIGVKFDGGDGAVFSVGEEFLEVIAAPQPVQPSPPPRRSEEVRGDRTRAVRYATDYDWLNDIRSRAVRDGYGKLDPDDVRWLFEKLDAIMYGRNSEYLAAQPAPPQPEGERVSAGLAKLVKRIPSVPEWSHRQSTWIFAGQGYDDGAKADHLYCVALARWADEVAALAPTPAPEESEGE